MMKSELLKEGIIKEEKALFIKSTSRPMDGNLYLTCNRIAMEAKDLDLGSSGLIASMFTKKVMKRHYDYKKVLDIPLPKISSLQKGTIGLRKNILEIKDQSGQTHRISVENYDEWESEINKSRDLFKRQTEK